MSGGRKGHGRPRHPRRSWAGLLLVLLGTAPSRAAPPDVDPPSGRLVKAMELGPAFRTVGDWHLAAYEPEDTGTPDPPNAAARLCLSGPNASGALTRDCTALTATVASVGVTYNLQTIDSIAVASIPTRTPGRMEPALVVRASYSGGGSGTLSKLFVWTYTRFDGTPFNHGPGGFFMEVFSDVVTDGGEQRFFLSGPLAGSFVSASQVSIAGPTMADPQHFLIRVYRRASVGFVQVLALLSARAYPTIRGGEPPADPIERELSRLARALAAVYPRGLPR